MCCRPSRLLAEGNRRLMPLLDLLAPFSVPVTTVPATAAELLNVTFPGDLPPPR